MDDIVKESVISDAVYNGKQKVSPSCTNFMSLEKVRECMLSLKAKNTEGFDRIPQRILKDGINHLAIPFTELMNRIYTDK